MDGTSSSSGLDKSRSGQLADATAIIVDVFGKNMKFDVKGKSIYVVIHSTRCVTVTMLHTEMDAC